MLMLKERFKRIGEDYKILLVMTIMPLIVTYFFSGGEKQEYKVALVQKEKKLELSNEFVEMTEVEALDAMEKNKVQGIVFLGDKNKFLFRQNDVYGKSIKKSVIRTLKEKEMLNYVEEIKEEKLNKFPNLPVGIKKMERPFNEQEEKAKTLLGFMVFFAMYPISYSIAGILGEKREGTWQRQLVSPLEKYEIIFTNFLYSVFLGLIQIYAVLLSAKYLFKVNFTGNFILILFLFALFTITVASLSLMLTTIIKNENQLGNALPIVTTASAMLAGCFWPFELVSNKILIALGYLMPQRWIIDSINKVGINKGSISLIIPNILILLLMSLVFFVVASRKEG